jgi:hypothetical protein
MVPSLWPNSDGILVEWNGKINRKVTVFSFFNAPHGLKPFGKVTKHFQLMISTVSIPLLMLL